MKTSEILINARQYIVDHGWCQNSIEKPDGKVCAMGAICKILPNGTMNEKYDKAEEVFESLLDKWIPAWNDSPRRTQAQVLKKFDEVISLALSEEAINE